MIKKSIIITILSVFFVVILSGVVFIIHNKQQKQKQESQVEQYVQIEEAQQSDLVWFEIPELNIKFQVEKDVADILGCRDFYIESSKANGKELYVNLLDDIQGQQDVFSEILMYKKNDIAHSSHKKPEWDEICVGSSSKILFKNEEEILCYNERNENSNIHSNQTVKRLFDGYLKAVVVEKIN